MIDLIKWQVKLLEKQGADMTIIEWLFFELFFEEQLNL